MTVGRTALDDGRTELEFLCPDEAEEITGIAFPLFREVYRETPTEIVEAFLQKTQTPESIRRQMGSGTIYAFIDYDGKRAGYVAYEACSEGMRLSKLYLFEEYRGNGIGGRILRFVEGEARKSGFGTVRLEVNEINPSAMEFYRSHGYSLEERIDFMRVVMRKRLDDKM